MKKILALVLVLIMALGLAACAAPAAPAEEPTPAAEPETEKVDSQAILAESQNPCRGEQLGTHHIVSGGH